MVSRPADASRSRGLLTLAAATLVTATLTYAAPSGELAAADVRTAGIGASTQLTAARQPPNRHQGDRGRLERTIRYLQDAQLPDGGFPGRPGGASDPGMSAWVALALAAGGVNPQDQRAAGGQSAYDYLVAHAGELSLTTDFERVLLVAIAAGADPRDFGGRDLVKTIVDRQLPDGSFPYAAEGAVGAVNATAFAVIPLTVIDDRSTRRVVRRALEWLVAEQGTDGSWSGNADLTASAIEALRAAGRQGTRTEGAAWNFLRRQAFLPSDGGFTTGGGEPASNTASTAWAVQGMWAAGLEPRTWMNARPTPLDFLTSMQDPASGKVRWKADDDLNPIWMTAYAAPAFAGYPLPIPAVARATEMPDQPKDKRGVTSGGGGAGAKNFSRPEPQSRGDTTGGVRDTSGTAQPDQGSTRNRSGSTDAQQRTTAASNGAGRAGVTRDLAADDAARGAGATQPDTPAPGSAQSGAQPQVAGMVVSAVRGGADGSAQLATEAIAPGLISADERRAGSLAAGIGSALLLCMLLGMKLERDNLRGRP